MNALTHGMKSYTLPEGTDREAIEAARIRWIECCNPQSEIALTLADWSFRCKVRMEFVAEADESAMAIRVRSARIDFQKECEQEFDAVFESFRIDSKQALFPMMQLPKGCAFLMTSVARLKEALGYGGWSNLHNQQLLALEGRNPRDGDPLLEQALNYLDSERACKSTIDSTHRSGPAGESVREGAMLDLDALMPQLTLAKDHLLGRLKTLHDRFTTAKEVATIARENLAKWVADEAKFDTSPEGRLRQRYLGEAQRDWFKATSAALAAGGGQEPAPAEIKPTAHLEAETTVEAETSDREYRTSTQRSAPPNEPKSPCNDCADQTGVTRVETSVSPTDDGPTRV